MNPSPDDGYSFLRWQDAVGIDGLDLTKAGYQYRTSTSDTMPVTSVFEEPAPPPPPSPSRNFGSGGSRYTPPAPTETWLNTGSAANLASGAKNRGENYVRTRSSGAYGIRASEWARFAGLRYEHDTMDGNAVQVRLYINSPDKITKDTMVSGYVKGAGVDYAKKYVEKYFGNKVQAIHFDQQGAWGQTVDVAAKVDLTGIDTENLDFYAYVKKTNTYRRIEKPAYWIDKNGYLHFSTEYAGDIIISEGLLERK